MTTEKDSIRIILERRGIINNGVFDEVRFRKLVTEPWIYAKTIKYGFDKMNENDKQVVDNEPVIEEVVETSAETVLLEEDFKEEIEEPTVEVVEEVVVEEPDVEAPSEEPVVDECPLYETAPVVVEEVVDTTKKKTAKKK